LLCGTHSGAFHGDDVLAFAMVRAFVDPQARVVRTRDLDVLAGCDIVFDVGGEYDPARGRFDHHQNDYTGALSSAGMVLQWLHETGRIPEDVANALRVDLVDYVDAVDHGRRTPEGGVPCFPSLIGTLTHGPADTMDARYLEAAAFAQRIVEGIAGGVAEVRRARTIVRAEMDRALEEGRRTLFFGEYLPWKRAYFDHGGADHPTDFVLLPAEGRWRIVAIPPEPGSFDTKVALPEARSEERR